LNALHGAEDANVENAPWVARINYTIKEERELALIERNINYDKETKRWIA